MQRLTPLALLLTTTVLLACNDAPTRPSQVRLDGSYTATTFTATTPDTTFDLLADGGSLTLTINGDGTTTGAQISGGVVMDLAGQWDTVADSLHLHLATPGLLTLTAFAIRPNHLEAAPLINNFAFHIRLTK
jgi:hypothetical protein